MRYTKRTLLICLTICFIFLFGCSLGNETGFTWCKGRYIRAHNGSDFFLQENPTGAVMKATAIRDSKGNEQAFRDYTTGDLIEIKFVNISYDEEKNAYINVWEHRRLHNGSIKDIPKLAIEQIVHDNDSIFQEPDVAENESIERYAEIETNAGTLKLGMSRDEVEAMLGQPDAISNTGEFEICDGVWAISWWYRLNSSDGSCVTLEFLDTGDGWKLDGARISSGCDWTAEGLTIGDSADVIETLFPTAQKGSSTNYVYDNETGTETAVQLYHYWAKDEKLSITTENDQISSISIGPVFEYPAIEYTETVDNGAPYSFSSGTISIYSFDAATAVWNRLTLTGRDAKKIETITTIQELEPSDRLPEDDFLLLDFNNGTIVCLYGEDDCGSIYQINNQQSFADAMNCGADPRAALTFIEICIFPSGTFEQADSFVTNES